MRTIEKIEQNVFKTITALGIAFAVIIVLLAVLYSLPYDMIDSITGGAKMKAFWGGVCALFAVIFLFSFGYLCAFDRKK